jgi:hypothetical protein
MAGFSSVTGDEAIMFADNASFDGTQRGGKMTADGQVWIGSVIAPHVRKGLPTGVASNSAPVMQAVYGNGTLAFENRNWETAYTVDSSSAIGVRGTFNNLQNAINAAVADGVASGTQMALIYIRDETISANITIPNNARIQLKGQAPASQFGSTTPITEIQGTVTLGNSSSYLVLENITFNQSNATGVILVSGSTCEATNCNISNISGAGTLVATNSTFGGLSGLSASYMVDCEMSLGQSGTPWLLQGTHHFINCYSRIGETCSLNFDTGGAGVIRNCTGLNISGNTNGVVQIEETTISAAVTLASATTRISGLTVDNAVGSVPTSLITTAPSLLRGQQQGNVMIRRSVTVNGNVTNNDQYVGCNKAGALAISLVTTNFIVGQVITFKDESGAAFTNNITITPTSGTIDGAATFVINTNYQAINLIFNGTNYFVF